MVGTSFSLTRELAIIKAWLALMSVVTDSLRFLKNSAAF